MKTRKDIVHCEHGYYPEKEICKFCKPQHTPTPWKVVEVPSIDLYGKQSGQATVTDSKGNVIAVVGRNSEADAKHIVRAVNSHEKYEEKIRNASAELRNVAGGMGLPDDVRNYLHELANDLYNVTIAKAEAK